ncbi:MAG: DUF5615 family PIN-like protein [Anaerolineae bacterium]|nr:DUF5615 family PIN-like protein [Anaerolineae bacterium]
MLSFVTDENFNNDILRGVIRVRPSLDIARVQDVGLRGANDRTILEWAAREGRILLSHDLKTIPRYALERVRLGLPMPGVVVASRDMAVGQTVEDIVLLADYSLDGEWENQVLYLPL